MYNKANKTTTTMALTTSRTRDLVTPLDCRSGAVTVTAGRNEQKSGAGGSDVPEGL